MRVRPLADLVAQGSRDTVLWRRTGAAIRKFHDAGVIHADLNARNILVGDDKDIYLVDFDRARLNVGDTGAFRANLVRLRRSLEKVWPPLNRNRVEPCWSDLLQSYDGSGNRA
jgi:3-deoxy-D-manno-octulosonic acid kinase